MQSVYTVGQINSYVKNMFTQDYLLQNLSVKGEVSNCKYHTSGHIYFTLKDNKGTISCVMFAGNRSGLAFRLIEGMQVIVKGSVDVYERDGRYQIYAKAITRDGDGALYQRFMELKNKLEERGMFASEYKKTLPRYIKTLGVVTASTGAAVQDIINITHRRNPYVQVILYPAVVQGEEAPASIVKGIHALETIGVDVMIVGRGGGSIEDLWAFNEEVVAQAVFDCTIPIISAVGHETDTTIIDYVSDLRAPTPSAAAELAVYDFNLLQSQLADYSAAMNRLIHSKIMLYKTGLQTYEAKLKAHSPMGRIREKRTYCMNLEDRLNHAIKNRLLQKKHLLTVYIERLKGLSPLEKLNQGYSYVSDMDGQTVSDVNKVQIDDPLWIYVKNGKIETRVINKYQQEREDP